MNTAIIITALTLIIVAIMYHTHLKYLFFPPGPPAEAVAPAVPTCRVCRSSGFKKSYP